MATRVARGNRVSYGPLVSILTPCFEHEQFLEDYFESLLEQSYGDIELIFYDDASKDRSWAIAEGYQGRLRDRFRRVVLRRNEENQGLLATMERLSLEIRGDIVCILESDDYFYPAKVEESVAFLQQHPDVGLVHSDVDFLDAQTDRLTPGRWGSAGRKIPEGEVFEDLLHENFILTCAMACRAVLFKDHADFRSYRQRGYRTADYPMFLDLSRTARFGYIDRRLAVYRVVRGSISHPQNEIGQLQWKLDYYRIKQDYIRRYPCRDEIRRRAESQLHRCLMELGWASGAADMFDRGHSWCREHDPERVSRWTQQARKLALRSGALWRVGRRLEAFRSRIRCDTAR